jgi:hypothetical protein
MKYHIGTLKFVQTFFFLTIPLIGLSQATKVGAYYFDGWKKIKGNPHLTPLLINEYGKREPKWGWLTSNQKVVDHQILAASDAQLDFFSFCWYYKGAIKTDSSNRALMYFKKSTVDPNFKYCLMVANHDGYEIGVQDWDYVCDIWIDNFLSRKYLKVDGSPILIFFSPNSLLKQFKNADAVKKAFEVLRTKAKAKGLRSVKIAACVGPNGGEVSKAESCGYDILTGYNYHGYGLLNRGKGVVSLPIDSMQTIERQVWDRIVKKTTIPYIPVSTLNWDPRPWANPATKKVVPFFSGYNDISVFKALSNCLKWIDDNESKLPDQKIALLYAWNEYGEGAYLTPSKSGQNVLKGVKRALSDKK